MNKRITLARTLLALALVLILFTPLAFLWAGNHAPAPLAAGAPSYSYENLFKRNTVITDRAVSYTLTEEVRDMAIGQLSADSNTDVVVATKTKLIIFEGNGDGSLKTTTREVPQPMSDIRSVAVGDLNKDGKDDIIATYINPSTAKPVVAIFDQQAGFAAMVEMVTYEDPGQVVVGKFNNSNENGFAVACRGNPGAGTSGKVMLARWPFFNLDDFNKVDIPDFTNLKLLTAGFVDGDDRMDLVAGNLNGPYLRVLLQPASFSSSWTVNNIDVPGSLTEVRMLNYAGNGVRDLAVVNSGENRVEIRVNSGTSLPAAATRVLGLTGVTCTGVGTVSGATLPDLAAVSSSANRCNFYPRQSGGLEPSVYVQFPTNVASIRAVALDSGSYTKGFYILSKGASGAPSTLDFFKYTASKVSNADGNAFATNGQPTQVAGGNVPFGIVATILQGLNSVYVSDLNGATKTITTTAEPTALFVGDLDGDDVDDLAIALGSSDSVIIYKGASNFMSKGMPDKEITLTLHWPQSLAGTRVEATATNVLAVGCQGGVEVIHAPLSSSPSHEIIGTSSPGDRTDVATGRLSPAGAAGGIAAVNSANGRVDLFYVKQSPSAGDLYDTNPNAWLNMVGLSPGALAIGDFDNNERDDVAVGSASLKAVVLFSNSGDGFYANTPYSGTVALSSAPTDVSAGDLNDDGNTDLAVAVSSRAAVPVLLSKGSSGFVNPFDLLPGGAANGVFCGDINGDARDDVVTSASSTKAVSYWLQRSLAPNALYWMSNSFIDEGGSVSFDASNSTDSASDISSLSYYWNFGDGLSSNLKMVTHRYIAGGSYDGYLVVTDRSGNSDRTDFHVEVANVLPIASFTVDPAAPPEGSVAWFNDTSSNYESITWQWEFGDGTPVSTSQNTTHLFAQNGTYPVTLTITDTDGQSSQKVTMVTVVDNVPTAGIRVSASTIGEGGILRFSDQSTSYPDPIVEWMWDFGDGNTSTSKDIDHRFPTKGDYTVTLTVKDSDGDEASVQVVVTVSDTPPVASFLISKVNPLKGETVIINDTSVAYDGVSSWSWDLGDGQTANTQDVAVSYLVPGQYVITLTIVDNEGMTATTNRTIVVQQSTPAVEGIVANGGESSFLMDQMINLEVVASEVHLPIVRYAWDFDYSSQGFQEAPNITLNHTTWAYSTPGEHTICVRVYDANAYTEKFLTVVIMNARPVADISAQSVKPGNFTFDSGRSYDTATDDATLVCRWNFGDGGGWTAWSSEKRALNNYTKDGVYSVMLEVRDQWGYVGSATYQAVVDNGPPVIHLDETALSPHAYRGEDMVIKVNVTDVSPIHEVLLVYTAGNQTRSLVMSQVSGTDTYVATIPAEDIDGPLVFHVVATDADGYSSESAAISVSVMDRPSDTWMYILAAALATIALISLMYFRAAAMVVDEVFIIYHDGNLMSHQTRRLKPGMDDQILGSMLVAIQNFVRDSFKDEASTGLNRLDFGDKKVLVEKGEYIYLAVVLHGKREGNVPQRMRDTISRTESDFSQALREWDGDLEKVRGIKEETDPLLRSGIRDVISGNSFKKGREETSI